MPEEKDALQIKIEEARMELPEDTRAAIDAVDWRGVIMQIRNKEGYDFIQLSELETETELLLCGLANPAEYPRRIEKGMGISHEAAQKLVSEMNEKIFKKIKEELIKISENKRQAAESAVPSPAPAAPEPILESREELLNKIEKPEKTAPHPLLAEKLSGPMQIPSSKTIHSLDNLTKPPLSRAAQPLQAPSSAPQKYSEDPYREKPE